VTGLIVNEFPNINRKYIRNVRAMIHAWEKFGLEKAAEEHFTKFNYYEKTSPNQAGTFKQMVIGKVGFIGFVRGRDDKKIYLRLRSRVKILSPTSRLQFHLLPKAIKQHP